MEKYAYFCDECGRGTNTLTNNMCTWCYNKWKKQQRIERKMARKRKNI